jgi:hypothetical protein
VINLVDDIKAVMEVCNNSKRFHAVYIYGETSVGKTYQVEKNLKEANIDGVFITTHITPMALYMFLYKNKDRVVVLDDLDHLNDTTISILKSALWEVNGKREICWLTSSSTLAENEVPMQFEFNGKIIITCNNMQTHGKLEPMLARMLVVNKTTTKHEFCDICKVIFDNYEVSGFEQFKSEFINIYTEGLHLRNVLKYCEYVKQGFVEQAIKLFEVNEYFKFFKEVSQVSLVSQRQKDFEAKFGLGRATFFRYWKKYKLLKEFGW